MKKAQLLFVLLLLFNCNLLGQGLNHQWLLGYGQFTDTFTTSQKARILFNTNNYSIIGETRKLAFDAAQANISDQNGNLLIATNGCWIMNSLGDTMMNGSGLAMGGLSNWCTATSGMPYNNSNLIVPFPGSSTKYFLFHHALDDINIAIYELYYTVIDLTLDNGLGGVVQKNQIALQDTLGIGVAACKHANGRDWWIVMLTDSSDLIYKILLTPLGILTITTQSLGINHHNSTNPEFSPDGTKFACRQYTGTWGNFNNQVRLWEFDRCTGNFSNLNIVQWQHTEPGLGLNFSSNSKYLYATTFDRIYQVNTDTSDIQASLNLVAINDGFYSPQPPFQTDFWVMYLAANGKIYISSGSSVIDMHYINYPDSGGIGCDVQQHALHLPCYFFRSHVNHPNYYLGCDTTCTPCLVSVNEISHDFKFNIYPNPSSGNFNIIYLLPQHKEGKLEIIDITGKIVYEMRLPQWSTLQQISLPNYISDGIYNCVITSDNYRASKKIAVVRN